VRVGRVPWRPARVSRGSRRVPACVTEVFHFDRPAPGQSSVDNLVNYADRGGFDIALRNVVLTGAPLARAITGDWARRRRGVPD